MMKRQSKQESGHVHWIRPTANIRQIPKVNYSNMSFQQLCCCLKSALDKQEGIDVEVNCISSCCASRTVRAKQGTDEPDGKASGDILQREQSGSLQSSGSSSSCFGCGDKGGQKMVEIAADIHSPQKCQEKVSN